MPLTPVYHCYADVDTFRAYLAGSGQTSAWTNDADAILRTLASVSRTIDQAVGGRCFGPRTETRLYDLGAGALRSDALLDGGRGLDLPDYWPARLTGVGIVPLGDWLIAATAVTAYSDTARTSNQALSAGYNADYLLEPYNDTPKHTLKLTETTARTLNAGQQTLSIAGSWGYQAVTLSRGTLGAAVSDTTGTSVTMAAGHSVAAGMTILIDSEQMYVRAVSGATLTVTRGVHGTTAATQSNGAAVASYEYPADVAQVCLEIARNRWRERDAGVAQSLGPPEMQMTRPGGEERALLRQLSWYLGRRGYDSVNF